MSWMHGEDPVPAADMPEAPRDPSIDSSLEEPPEDGRPRARDEAMGLYLSRIENLKVAVRYLLAAGDGTDKDRARSMAADLLRRMDAQDRERFRR